MSSRAQESTPVPSRTSFAVLRLPPGARGAHSGGDAEPGEEPSHHEEISGHDQEAEAPLRQAHGLPPFAARRIWSTKAVSGRAPSNWTVSLMTTLGTAITR